MYLEKIITEGVGWIQLAEDKDHLRADGEYRNEPLGSMKYGEILEFLLNSQVLKQSSVRWNRSVTEQVELDVKFYVMYVFTGLYRTLTIVYSLYSVPFIVSPITTLFIPYKACICRNIPRQLQSSGTR